MDNTVVACTFILAGMGANLWRWQTDTPEQPALVEVGVAVATVAGLIGILALL